MKSFGASIVLCGAPIMNIQIKLRREFRGQNGWESYLEEIGLDFKGRLAYRKSRSIGFFNYGVWGSWRGENEALNFLLGEAAKSINQETVYGLRMTFQNVSNLTELPLTSGVISDQPKPQINFGTY